MGIVPFSDCIPGLTPSGGFFLDLGVNKLDDSLHDPSLQRSVSQLPRRDLEGDSVLGAIMLVGGHLKV